MRWSAPADNEAFKQGLIDAFHEEYRTQFVLSHLKGFPALYGYGTIDGLPAILREWVEGETLRHARTTLATEAGAHRTADSRSHRCRHRDFGSWRCSARWSSSTDAWCTAIFRPTTS